ncbi:TPA: hypothetical protein N0F65_007977 [Lagenidium giganteum]|uniref:P-type ATPase A domain-containing protein n=1 Tax=Lagenidium giganteum TaxID=4803 RepID=A0AAV2YIG6_9STRA|nr:TPA: hypothetical protein N0F65_007977 [Lagenidium giganteum]
MDQQTSFAACPTNHQPEFVCCEYGDTKILYTRYRRPVGGPYEKFYEQEWHQPRQVNLPEAFYTPNSPAFQYDDPANICRAMTIVNNNETDGVTKLLGDLEVPNMVRDHTNADAGAAVNRVEQSGYASSWMGSFIYIYFVVATLGLFPTMVVLILDSNHQFTPQLFDRSNVLIVVYIVCWIVMLTWLTTLVLWSGRLSNFFRLRAPLDRCKHVHMFNAELTEILLHDRTGAATCIAKLERMLAWRSLAGYEKTILVQGTEDGHRYVEFQHLRYIYDEVHAKFVPGVIPVPDTFSLIFCFFYVYQLMCYYVWYFNGYWNVAFLNTISIIGVITINIVTKRKILAAVTIKSIDLVPGDLVRVSENWQLPCDLVIIKGSTVCDESMLTGESMPVQKFAIPDAASDTYLPEQSGKKHTLFSGSKTLVSGRDEEILAIVLTTGAQTVRGKLVQSILYPALVRFKYDEHLKACVAFLLAYGVVASNLAMKFLMANAGIENKLFAFVYGMFFMLSAALSRCDHSRPSKYFKATGAAALFLPQSTADPALWQSCMPLDPNAKVFQPEFSDITSIHLHPLMKFAMASCHAVGSLDGKLMGNEVEVRMFESTHWKLFEEEGKAPIVQSHDASDALEVVKRFEFDHNRMSMSVVVRLTTTGRVFVFCKASYEKMQEVADPSTVPSDYAEKAELLARHGCYVLGMGYKDVTHLAGSTNATWQAFLADRDAVELDLTILGLVMFQNELKLDSAEAIAQLRDGGIRCIMITGDDALTGCYIARECGMVRGASKVVLGDIMATNDQGGKGLVWKDVDSDEVVTHKELVTLLHAQEVDDSAAHPALELAVTDQAFNYLSKMEDLPRLLFHIRIFSRMTPAEKVGVITALMKAGVIADMCGDGGNDCGALRIAHVGVALSDTEASVVSPFTSEDKSIASVVDLCKEGRCSLATVFANLKFLIMYSLIGSGLRFVMYWNAVFMSEWCFTLCDGAVLVGLSYAITLARPLSTLGKQRPTSSLIGPTTLLSMLGQQVIHTCFLYYAIHHVMQQPWYCPVSPENVDLVKWWLLQDSNLGTAIFMIIAPQQMIGAVAYSFGSHFRQPIWKNRFLVIYFAALAALIVYLSLAEPNVLNDRFRMASGTNVIGLPDIPLPYSQPPC